MPDGYASRKAAPSSTRNGAVASAVPGAQWIVPTLRSARALLAWKAYRDTYAASTKAIFDLAQISQKGRR
jgi:hypothetical protein